MDPDNYDVSVGGENVSLTAREFEILRASAGKSGTGVLKGQPA